MDVIECPHCQGSGMVTVLDIFCTDPYKCDCGKLVECEFCQGTGRMMTDGD